MQDQELAFVCEPGAGVTGLRVYFVMKRLTIYECHVRGLPEGVGVASSVHSDYGVDVSWDQEVPSGTEIVLAFRLEGEPIVVAHTIWRNAEGSLMLAVGRAEKHVSLLVTAAGSIRDFETYSAAMFLARCSTVQNHPSYRVRRYGSFFCDLDLYTNRKLIAHSGLSREEIIRRTGIIFRMERCLIARLHMRREAQSLPVSPDADIQHISSILLDIYRQHLSGADCRIDPEEVWTAFEMFANGELRVYVDESFAWNGEPDSGAIFCFAEFGFMAVQRGIDLAEWTAILPSQVAIQRIFMTAYRPWNPASGPFRFDAYKPKNWSKGKMVGPKTKAELRAAFWGESVDKLAVTTGEHLREAFSQIPPLPCRPVLDTPPPLD